MFIVIHRDTYIGPFETEKEVRAYIEKIVASIRREYGQHSDIRPDPFIMDHGWSEFGHVSYTLDVYDEFGGVTETYVWTMEKLTNPQ